MKNNARAANKAEKERNDTILSLHCICRTLSGDFRKRPLEVHHIVRGNKRLGHWFTLQLCAGHHRGEYTDQPIRVGIASGRHAFKEAYGYDELELWQKQQVALRLDDELPKTKVMRRDSVMATILMLCVVLRADMHRECWPLKGETCEQAQHRWVEQAANWNRRVALPPAALCGCALVPKDASRK